MENLVIKSLDLVDYQQTFQLMRNFTLQRNANSLDEVWLLQHQPVFTLGYSGDRKHILMQSEIPIVASDRGGNITYHGPGQLVGYILIDLKRKKMKVHDLVRLTESFIIDILQSYSIQGHTIHKSPGVYVNNTKICSLGFRIKNGYSYHGFALNINMDLKPFSYINPCGLEGMKITQMNNYVQNIDIDQVAEAIKLNLHQHFGYTQLEVNN